MLEGCCEETGWMLEGYWRDGKARQTNNGATPLRYMAMCHTCPLLTLTPAAQKSFAFSPVLVHLYIPGHQWHW